MQEKLWEEWILTGNTSRPFDGQGGAPMFPLVDFTIEALTTIGKFMFWYFCHTNVVVVATTLDKKHTTDKQMMIIAGVNVGWILIFYVVITNFAFYTFGTNLKPLFVENYNETWVLPNIARLLLSIQMLFGIPMNYGPMRESAVLIFKHHF